MNSIPILQNSQNQLDRLAAQRQLYSTAKAILGWQFILSAPLAVGLAFSVIYFPTLKSYVALWGILVTLSDLSWLTPWQKRLRNSAARVQELFDCDVLGLPWDDLKGGKRPDPELIREQSDRYKKWSQTMPPLSDWYSNTVGELPLHIASLVCQRTNCWWDGKQRRRYALAVIFCTVAIFVSILFLSLGTMITIEDFVIMVVAPLSPALILGYRQYSEQMEAATRIDKLKEHAEKLWAEVFAKQTISVATTRSRRLQDEILEHRSKSPLVFDGLFKNLRPNYETQMNHGANELVLEAKQKLGLL